MEKVFLHIGCGNRQREGFINTDKDEMDLSKPWPYADESVDGIVSMHVMQQLTWRELAFVAFPESYRVLKKGGVMRMGVPAVEITDRPLDFLLGFKNITLFSVDLLEKVLIDRIGYKELRKRGFRRSVIPELASLDNRYSKGTIYFDAIK